MLFGGMSKAEREDVATSKEGACPHYFKLCVMHGDYKLTPS